MTTHVFIVDDKTFNVHLRYMFVGTGSKDKKIDFNGVSTTKLKYQTENGLVSMMADFSRVRIGDFVVFYLQQSSGTEGKFYGIFKIASEPFLDSSGVYLKTSLGKSLTFRIRIEPYQVFANGVTEWQALDCISGLTSPNQMLWSLIYRKLKGNRGCTMITIYEAERLFDMIRTKNHGVSLNGTSFKYDSYCIVEDDNPTEIYAMSMVHYDILPRLIRKYNGWKAHEAHLQMYITQNLGKGTNLSLDIALEANLQNEEKIEWLGNEVSCGVGMQRIDIMYSKQISETERVLYPIELKAVPIRTTTIDQMCRYVDWICQYYKPNRISTIRPILLCRHNDILTNSIKASLQDFNEKMSGVCLDVIYVEYEISNNNIIFTQTPYIP